MAECYPELLRLIWKFEPFKIQNVIVRNPYIADIIEKLVAKTSSHIFVMIEESKQRLLEKGIPERKITVVSNTPVLQRFQNAKPTFPGSMRTHQGKLILLYVGFS